MLAAPGGRASEELCRAAGRGRKIANRDHEVIEGGEHRARMPRANEPRVGEGKGLPLGERAFLSRGRRVTEK
jgi:hypothetical protein